MEIIICCLTRVDHYMEYKKMFFKSLRKQALIFTLDLHVMIDAETTR